MRLFGSCSVLVSVLYGCRDPDTSVTFVWLISLEPDIFLVRFLFCRCLVLSTVFPPKSGRIPPLSGPKFSYGCTYNTGTSRLLLISRYNF